MPTQAEAFAHSIITDSGHRQLLLEYLAQANGRGPVWPMLPGLLRGEIERFERLHIAAGYASILGAERSKVARRQDFLVRTAYTSILFPLEAFEDRLLSLLEQRGLPALYHHVVKEFAADESVADAHDVYAIAAMCRSAVFELEDQMREIRSAPDGPGVLVDTQSRLVSKIQRSDHTKVPFGWEGVALLWVTSLIDLGNLPSETSTTEHYIEW